MRQEITRVRNVHVFVWRSGLLEFGWRVPAGAIAIASGERLRLRRIVYGLARLSYDNSEMLIPGVPEALNDDQKLSALKLFTTRVRERLLMGETAGAAQ